MYVTAVGFAVSQFVAFWVLVLYVTVANKKAKSPFVGIFGIACASAIIPTIVGVGFVVSITPIDATAIVLSTICLPACAILELTIAYTFGDLLYYAGGSAKLKKPDFSNNSSNLGLWVIVPLWVVASCGQLLILLTTEWNPIIFGVIALIIALLAINFGYLRFADTELVELAASTHALRFLTKHSASKPAYGRQNDPVLHSNMAAWVFIVTALEALHTFIGLILSFILPPFALSSIVLALCVRTVLSISIFLWGHFMAHNEETRKFFFTERGGLNRSTSTTKPQESQGLTHAEKVTVPPTQLEIVGLLES